MGMFWFSRRNDSETVRIAWLAARSKMWVILVVAGAMMTSALLALLFPLLFKVLIDTALPGKDVTLIAWLIAGMAGIPMLLALLNLVHSHLTTQVGASISQRIRAALLDHVLGANMLEVEKRTSGELENRLMGDAARIGDLFVAHQVLPSISSTFTLVGTVLVMAALSGDLTIVAVMLFPLSFYASSRIGRAVEPLEQQFSVVTEEGFSRLNQILAGLRTIRAFNGETREKNYWRDWMVRHWKLFSRLDVLMAVRTTLTSDVVTNVAIGMVWSMGAYRTMRGDLTACRRS